MEHTRIPAPEPMPVTDLDMLLAEADAERPRGPEAAGGDDPAAEPADAFDAFDAQILAGLVSP
jgi:hypothetical protein